MSTQHRKVRARERVAKTPVSRPATWARECRFRRLLITPEYSGTRIQVLVLKYWSRKRETKRKAKDRRSCCSVAAAVPVVPAVAVAVALPGDSGSHSHLCRQLMHCTFCDCLVSRVELFQFYLRGIPVLEYPLEYPGWEPRCHIFASIF